MSDIKYALYTSSKGFKVVGGTAAQFLKADGSIDTGQYIPYNGANENVNLNGKNFETSGRLTAGNEILNLASATVYGTGIIDIKLPNMNIMGVFYIDIFTYGALVGTFVCQFYTYYNNSLNFAGNNSVAFLGRNSNGLTVRYVTVGTGFSSERHIYIGNLTTNWGNWTEINIRGLINVNREPLKSNPPEISLITAEASPLNTSFTFNDFSVESALKLGSSRNINGTPFNATADITTDIWGTSRNLTIGNSTKLVNGSGNVAWTLPEIGALPLSGGELTGALTIKPSNGSGVLEQDVLTLHDSGTSEGNIIPLAFKYGVSATPTAFIKAVGKGSSGSNGATFQFFDNTTKHTEINSSGVTANAFIKAGGTAAQFLKADGSVDSNSYLPATSASNYPLRSLSGGDVNSIRVLDTRNTNPLPSTEIRAGVLYDFKTSSAIGLSGTDVGTYSAAITMVPYTDNSGNINTAFRLAQTANSMYFQNYISAGKWGPWNKLLTGGDLLNYYTKTESLNLFVGKTGIETISDTKTFTSSPIIPNGTLGTHAVNKNQIQLSTGNEGENGQQLTISGNNSVNLTNFFVTSRDGSRNPNDIAPNSTPKRVRFDFAAANIAGLGASGNYAGIMTYSPWDGTSASTGDSSYQLAFANQTGINGSGVPMLKIRKGIDGNWTTSWYKFWTETDFTLTNIQQWNDAYQNGIRLNQDFTIYTGNEVMISDNYFENESGLVDASRKNFIAGKINEYYKYGSNIHGGFEGINYHVDMQTIGIGGEADKNKVSVQGCVKATENFKSKDEQADTIFIPNGNTASLRDEIVNDESEYAIRLDPHHYEIDGSGNLEVDDRNRLIHVIGEQIKMAVNFREIYPKQQIVIYNFDQKNYPMAVLIHDKHVYNVEPGCFLRLYVTKSLRVIAERQQPCEFIW